MIKTFIKQITCLHTRISKEPYKVKRTYSVRKQKLVGDTRYYYKCLYCNKDILIKVKEEIKSEK